jgi:hypothetical protein
MDASQATQRFAIAEHVHHTAVRLQRSRNHDEDLSARSEAGKIGLDVLSDRFELQADKSPLRGCALTDSHRIGSSTVYPAVSPCSYPVFRSKLFTANGLRAIYCRACRIIVGREDPLV